MGYARSPFRSIESYLTFIVDLNKEDIQLILKQNSSNFITYEKSPSIYPIKDFSEVVYTMADHEGTLLMKHYDISIKTKHNLTRFGGIFGSLRFNEKLLFNTLSGLTTYWGL